MDRLPALSTKRTLVFLLTLHLLISTASIPLLYDLAIDSVRLVMPICRMIFNLYDMELHYEFIDFAERTVPVLTTIVYVAIAWTCYLAKLLIIAKEWSLASCVVALLDSSLISLNIVLILLTVYFTDICRPHWLEFVYLLIDLPSVVLMFRFASQIAERQFNEAVAQFVSKKCD